MGDWKDVYHFFQSLQGRPCPEHGIVAKLDNAKELRFRKGGGSRQGEIARFWSQPIYTQRSIFEKIVDVLLAKPSIAKCESTNSAARKLWHLLAGFEFHGGKTTSELQKQVDQYLLERVDVREQLDEKRDAMLTGLARRATEGDARIDRQEFLAQYLLSSTALSDSRTLIRKGKECLQRTFGLRGYGWEKDVRQDLYAATLAKWPSDRPMLLLAGDSGQGKTWFLFGLGTQIVRVNELCVSVDARGDAERTIQKAADTFWQEIKGNDGILPLARIAARRSEVVQRYAERWLTILIDGVQDFDEARSLAIQPWEEWGVRVIISCSQAVARTIAAESHGRATTQLVEDFTEEELQQWLTDRFGDEWPSVPRDVRDTLKRPLLAALYETVSTGRTWRAMREYELFEAYWRRLSEGQQERHPLDALALKRAAYSLLKGGKYPWSPEDLKTTGFDNEGIARLQSVGWLRKTSDGHFEVWHDRLLNWAVAQGLIGALHQDQVGVDEFCTMIASLFAQRKTFAGRYLGYVPMDVVWALAHRSTDYDGLLNKVIEALEATDWPGTKALHEELLPTIGARIVPALFGRLVTTAPSDNTILQQSVVRGISQFEPAYVTERASELLKHDSPLVQRAAMRVLTHKPTEKALDDLWKRHVAMKKSAAPYLREHESWHVAYKDSFDALRACVRLNPSWIEQKVSEANFAQEPAETLTWLLASLQNGRELWMRCKKALFGRIPPDKERSLAANIYSHRDESEIKWLRVRSIII